MTYQNVVRVRERERKRRTESYIGQTRRVGTVVALAARNMPRIGGKDAAGKGGGAECASM